jgi:hypothetical protein
MTRWKKRQPSATEKRQANKAQADRNCQRGQHLLTNTFRPGERTCTNCGLLLYCPDCLTQSHLTPLVRAHMHPLPCAIHKQMEVHA